MSGGIQNVRAEDIIAINSDSAVRVKTAIGRGGCVKDIFVTSMNLETMKYVFWMTGNYGSHPDNGYDPKALPVIENVNYKNVVAKNVTIVGKPVAIEGASFTGICISIVKAELAVKKVMDIEEMDEKEKVPKHCDLLPEKQVDCSFPVDQLAIDGVELKTCSLA